MARPRSSTARPRSSPNGRAGIPGLAGRPRLDPSPLPPAPEPMLCTLVADPFDHPDWTFEPKHDGLRILARFDGRTLALASRNGKEQGGMFPEIADGLRASLARPAIVDGEVVCFDDQGRSSFRKLQQRFHLIDPAEIRARMEQFPAYLYLFDILYYDRYDLTSLPLADRKQVLRAAVAWSDRVRPTDSTAGRGVELLKDACRQGTEGIIGKRLDSRYVAGRSDAWVKIKCLGRQEFVIGGFTDPQRSRVGLGALLVGYYEGNGRRARLAYAGKVGTGYTREVLLDLRKTLEKIERPASPFDQGDPPEGPTVHWVEPRLVAEIAFGEWTQNGLLRQPRFEGLRPDKAPRQCRRERAQAGADEARVLRASQSARAPKARHSAGSRSEPRASRRRRASSK